ncbi:MAG TPA: cell division protein FtsZ [Candidatus Kapabacteria bacterium]|nr:cell division protein FtsZ [Candidatus Kapabacteria bacterium]HOV91696.1 cell division protein FtsZ [Candidatus Kapabacteria bacterium]
MLDSKNLSIDIETPDNLKAVIKVVGVGGAGGNAITSMVEGKIRGVELIAANTDAQALQRVQTHNKIQLGRKTTKGLGAGTNPEVGRKAAEEAEQEITEILKGSDMVFITCGMGGGTGTGGSPVFAKIAKDLGALVVGIVTYPFSFEGNVKIENAKIGIAELSKNVDALITIPNQRIYDIINTDVDIDEALLVINQILFNSTRGISDIINYPGLINVDFADVRTIMSSAGHALMGIGTASGENRAEEAALKAINSPLLDGISIKGAKGVLINITSGKRFLMSEFQTINTLVENYTGEDVIMKCGVVKNDADTDELSVTVIATGFNQYNLKDGEQKNLFGETIEEKKDNKIDIENTIKQIRQNGYKFAEEKQQNNTEKVSIPSGGNALKGYDIPAIIRKGSPQAASYTTLFPDDDDKSKKQTNKEENSNSNNFEMHRGIDFLSIKPEGFGFPYNRP